MRPPKETLPFAFLLAMAAESAASAPIPSDVPLQAGSLSQAVTSANEVNRWPVQFRLRVSQYVPRFYKCVDGSWRNCR